MEEIKKLNIYQKLQKSRVELQNKNLKKSGTNKYAGFSYYELADFIPSINEIFNNNGLISMFNLDQEKASLTILDMEDTTKTITFETPVAEVNLKGCTEIQSLGGKHTYLKRYLYLNALEIVESDMLDAKVGDMQLDNKKESTASPKQIEILEKVYYGENLQKLLNANGINELKDLPIKKASELIMKLKEKSNE